MSLGLVGLTHQATFMLSHTSGLFGMLGTFHCSTCNVDSWFHCLRFTVFSVSYETKENGKGQVFWRAKAF